MIVSIDGTENYDEDSLSEFVKNNRIIVLDFFAEWCGPCKELSPKLVKINEKFPDVKILKIDIEQNNDMADKYDIQSLPTLLFLYDGSIVHKETGVREEGKNIVCCIANLIIKAKYHEINVDQDIYDNEIHNKINELLSII